MTYEKKLVHCLVRSLGHHKQVSSHILNLLILWNFRCIRTVQMTVMMITNREDVVRYIYHPCLNTNYNKRKKLITIWWIVTFIHRRCRLLVSRNAFGVNKSDFAGGKRKIPMPEIDREKNSWLT